ncbi:hypothetical protein [Ktedonobacter robiniae]|uniref:Uncharacterized protein n=1 Tax=Ktedonobacter robiniae TaxID=2778365 RepID=A0ABQ3UP21_9CHLR|nr:hypothetical protein [Ktedonobacter robiniae]GHO54491.1 hypothetical protein KSB_29660 [Ktedonobacter robiniae]
MTSSDTQNPQEKATLTGLFRAEYTCPICHKVIISLTGNTIQYDEDHVKVEKDENGADSIVLYHRPNTRNFVPAKILDEPFLVIKSSSITSF